MTIREMAERTEEMNKLSRILRKRNEAWDAGYDCALNGANDKNCHFGWFSSPSYTRQWELGKVAGEQDLAARKRGAA